MEVKRKEIRLTTTVCILYVCVTATYCKTPNEYKVQIPSKFCKPCQGSGNGKDGGCGLLRNDTFEILNQVQAQFLGPILGNLQYERDLMGKDHGADTNKADYDIADLENIEHSKISKYLRSGNKVEKIIHHSYGRLMIQIAYFNLYKEITRQNADLRDKIIGKTKVDEILEQLERLSCRLYDSTHFLGIRKIKKKLCKFIELKIFTEVRDEKEYLLSILNLEVKNFNSTIGAMQSLTSSDVIDNCHYDCSKNGKKVLKCKEEDNKQLRNATPGRKHRRNRKNKNKGRRRKNKERKNCKKNKENKRQCRNRRRNRKKTQRRKSKCPKCK